MTSKQIIRIIGIATLLICMHGGLQAQKYGNAHPFDFKRFNLGFLMGLNYNSYNLKEQINVLDEGILLERIRVLPKYGLNLGMITNMSLHKQVSLRFVPTISLEQRDFDYHFAGDSVIVRKIEASYLNLPVMFQFKTKYYRATRVYVLTGAQLGINLASNKKVRNDPNLLKITTHDFSLTFGAGVNLYGDRIKLSPEILYTVGLFNIYQPEFTSHPFAIERLTSQVIAINVNFE
ncbi:MAG: porin family protein [Bacteroidota bacterium]